MKHFQFQGKILSLSLNINFKRPILTLNTVLNVISSLFGQNRSLNTTAYFIFLAGGHNFGSLLYLLDRFSCNDNGALQEEVIPQPNNDP